MIETSMNQYLNKAKTTVTECVIQIVLAMVTFILLLYLCRMMWSLFAWTPVGRHHFGLYPERSRLIAEVLNKDFVWFSIHLLWRGFKIGFLVSALCRFLHVQRLFYLPMGAAGRVLLWGLPVTFLVAKGLALEYGIDLFAVAFGVSLVPAIWMTMVCFKLNSDLIPEAGPLFFFLKDHISRK